MNLIVTQQSLSPRDRAALAYRYQSESLDFRIARPGVQVIRATMGPSQRYQWALTAILGLVTAADLLESIAGDGALGENEGISQPFQRDDGSWLIDGMTPIDEFEQTVGARGLDEGEGYSTVAGLVMHLMNTVPKEGDVAERWPLAFEVIDMDGRRVDKVIVRRLEASENNTG